MANLNFRDLRADEIDVRIAMVKENGLSLLLYKDARCDMNILDETVGAFNWQRLHNRDNANCIVSIWDTEKGQWIQKEDTGTESNTEAAKGLASDSFKRACFNWGIGRELYTAPFIWISANDCNLKNGKCYDKFSVQDITIKDKKIVGLSIYNESTKKVVYTFGKVKKEKANNQPTKPVSEKPAPVVEQPKENPAPVNNQEPAKSPARIRLREFCVANNIDQKLVIKECGLNQNSTDADYERAYEYAFSIAPSGNLPFEV